MSEWGLRLGVPGGALTAVVLAAGLAVAVAWATRELRGLPDSRRRRILLAARIASAVALWLVAVQPILTGEEVEHVEGRLAVLVDSSRSMSVSAGAQSRAETVRGLLSEWQGGEGADRASVYTFGSETRPSTLQSLAEEYHAVDDDTFLAAALEETVGRDLHGELGAVVIVSDGAETERTAPPLDLGIRVHTVAVGAGFALHDDSIADVKADPVAFLRQPARVRVRLRSSRPGSDIPVALRRGDQVLREAAVTIDDNGDGEVELPFTPDELGRSAFRVTIPLSPRDAVPENNERAFLVRVVRDKLRVLLVAGQPSWDVRFLRAFLKRDPAIDLISFFILRSASDLTMADGDELALIPFPTEELFTEHLGSFDLIVFQNFDYRPYQMGPHLPRIRDYVERGGAFAMIGGDEGLASGGYADTPLAVVLPVALPPADTPATALVHLGAFQPLVEPALARHPLVTLANEPGANARLWGSLAALDGINLVGSPAASSQVLLSHPDHRVNGRQAPVLVVGEFGKGRTLVLATDTAWRWGMTTAGLTGDPSAYTRFWDRALRWLTRDPNLEPARVTTDRERYGPAARVRIALLLRDARYEPVSDRSVRLAVLADTGEELAFVQGETDGQGAAELSVQGPERVGAYRVTATVEGEAEPRCEESFVVEAGGDELAWPEPRPDHLRRIAEESGGTFIDLPANAPDLAAFDAHRTRVLGITDMRLLGTPWALLALLVVLAVEWALRRSYGRR